MQKGCLRKNYLRLYYHINAAVNLNFKYPDYIMVSHLTSDRLTFAYAPIQLER